MLYEVITRTSLTLGAVPVAAGIIGDVLMPAVLALRDMTAERRHDLLVEGGNLAGGDTELDSAKMFTALQCLFGLERQYDALGVGSEDLRIGS